MLGAHAVKRSTFASALMLLVVGGCAGSPVTADGVTLLRSGFLMGSPAALNSGTMDFSTGCVVLDQGGIGGERYVVIWPSGTTFERVDDVLSVVVGDLAIHDGDVLSLGGGAYKGRAEVEGLTGSIPSVCLADRYWLATSVEHLD